MTSVHRSKTGKTATRPLAPERRSSHRRRGSDPDVTDPDIADGTKDTSATPDASADGEGSDLLAVDPPTGKPTADDDTAVATGDPLEEPESPDDDETAQSAVPAVPTLARLQVLVALTIVLAVVVTAAIALSIHADRAGHHALSTNDAFVDSTATTTMIENIGKVVETVFTVNPSNIAATEQAAKDSLTGRATDQYERLYRPLLQQQAPAQSVTVTTTVRSVGVTALNGDRAEVLVLADQAAKNSSTGQSDVGAAHIGLILERQNGPWKISSIEIF
ncbi:hypothetical protein [Protofrankia symbiont of Coriaria ruscifolia]|uniref:Mce-associated membrane protein n=1 Tax=Candidatus Protofrankia californiensis TaxID=1839754 RepID=A0A1C3NZ82_9ACTN|nr:hypothetical protein [Protofrankia symbiont of Coriaria ruscifolia]SBW22835.1 hypothetical protein FDG2_3200 [Candidatus Protofrankia californiensis]